MTRIRQFNYILDGLISVNNLMSSVEDKKVLTSVIFVLAFIQSSDDAGIKNPAKIYNKNK